MSRTLIKPTLEKSPAAAKAALVGPAATELALYAAIQQNSPDWQKRVFDHFRSLVYRLLIKILGPNAEIEDLLGDIFVSLFESAPNIRNPTALRSYVVSVTMNAARRELTRRRRWALFHVPAFTRHEVEQRPSQDDPKAKAALLQLSRILEELDVDERMAFVLHNLEGMPLPEVAAVLRLSHSTVKRRVKRANTRLLQRVSRNVLLADYIREKTQRSKSQRGVTFPSTNTLPETREPHRG